MNKPKIVKESRPGVWYLGKQNEDGTGLNVYLDTHLAMGTGGKHWTNFNYMGHIVMSKFGRLHEGMAINYFLHRYKEAREELKFNARWVIAHHLI